MPRSNTARALVAGLTALLLSEGAALANDLVPRTPGVKKSFGLLLAMPASDEVVVKFREGTQIRSRMGGLTAAPGVNLELLDQALRTFGLNAGEFEHIHDARSEADLDSERLQAQAKSGRVLADLNLYYRVDVPAGTSAASVANRLNQLPFVEFSEPAAIAAPPPGDIAPPTRNLAGLQTYRGMYGNGLAIPSAKLVPGVDGTGIQFVDVEYAWTLNHEDLTILDRRLPQSVTLTGGATATAPYGPNHGTAVLGMLIGGLNGYGITGLTPNAVGFVAPTKLTSGYRPERAIGLATDKLRPGDVIVIEQQTTACGYSHDSKRYGPLEYYQPVFDAIATATAKGIIVVEAGGNGNVNLDSAYCEGLFDRSERDSGAIIVGAGSSQNRARMPFSSYGSRIDVQAWGENVVTTGYGDAFPTLDIRQRYTLGFGGTSSATPMVAAAAIAIQGVRKACGKPPLTPHHMRNLLVNTGAAQPAGEGHIGPMPRVDAALQSNPIAFCQPLPLPTLPPGGVITSQVT